MSKIIAEFDTQDKSFSVKMDGKEMADVDSVSFYKMMYNSDGSENDGDEYCAHVHMSSVDDDEGIREHRSVHAAELETAGIIVQTESRTAKAIAELFS